MIGPSTVERGGFPTKPLGSVAEFLDHQRKPITAKDREPGPIPYYGANGQQDSVADWLFDEPLVLLAEDGGHFETPERGIAYRIDGKSWVNNHAHVLRAGSSVDTTWLTRVLENYDVTSFITGSTRAKLTKSGAARIPIPVPPIEEQRRIAAVLDAADELRAKRRDALAKLDTLTQAIFVDMFGDLGMYDRQPFGSLLLQPPRNGISPSKAGKVSGRVLTLSAITGPRFDASQRKESTFASLHADDKTVDDQDFLICRGNGNLTLVGRAAFPDQTLADVAFPDTMIAARPDPRLVSRAFLSHIWTLDEVRRQVEARARTTNGTYKVNQGAIAAIEIALPPIVDQARFAEAVGAIAFAAQVQRASQTHLDTLFASLQQRAFRGVL